jgi:hypothetical protein
VVKGDLPLVLISSITFTSKGVILLQDDHAFSWAQAKGVLRGATHGHRDTRRRHCGS